MNGDRGVLNRYLKRPVAAACESLPWRSRWTRSRLMGVLDLFEEHVYAGGGHARRSIRPPRLRRQPPRPCSAARCRRGSRSARLGVPLVPGEVASAYDAFNRRLLAGRGRGRDISHRPGAGRHDNGCSRDAGHARARRAAGGAVDRRHRLGRHGARGGRGASWRRRMVGSRASWTWSAHTCTSPLAYPDGSLEELFQGPGGDRLLGGAEPDSEMVNWDAAVHPDDRAAYDEFNQRAGPRVVMVKSCTV